MGSKSSRLTHREDGLSPDGAQIIGGLADVRAGMGPSDSLDVEGAAPRSGHGEVGRAVTGGPGLGLQGQEKQGGVGGDGSVSVVPAYDWEGVPAGVTGQGDHIALLVGATQRRRQDGWHGTHT